MARRAWFQEHIDFTATTNIKLKAAKTGTEGGITIYATPASHYDLYIIRDDNNKDKLELRYRLNELTHTEASIDIPKNQTSVELRVTGKPECYAFSYSFDGGKNFNEIASMNTRYLSTETAGGFTGTMIGLYIKVKPCSAISIIPGNNNCKNPPCQTDKPTRVIFNMCISYS